MDKVLLDKALYAYGRTKYYEKIVFEDIGIEQVSASVWRRYMIAVMLVTSFEQQLIQPGYTKERRLYHLLRRAIPLVEDQDDAAESDEA